MLTIARSSFVALHRPLSIANVLRQFDRLNISTSSNASFSDPTNSKSPFGFSCSSPTSTLLLSHLSNANTPLPIIEQRRFLKFFREQVYNFKHKQGHKPVFRPYYKWDFEQLEGKEYTAKPFKLRKLGGRDPKTGAKVNQRIGGGYNFDYFWIDYRRNRFSSKEGGCYEERLLEVRRAANTTPYVALACGAHGRRWILATDNMKAGDVIRSYNYIPNKMLKDYEMPDGDSWPLGALPAGTRICNIQEFPSADYNLFNHKSDYSVINAGASATILRQQGEYTVVQVTKLMEVSVKRECIAVLGQLSNAELRDLHWGSMRMKRRWGIKQGTGVWHKKDGYCGRKFHPLKKKVVDIDKEPEPPMAIPITLTKKDLNGSFGNKTTMPIIEGSSTENKPFDKL